MSLEKAHLVLLNDAGAERERWPVQFNPMTMNLEMKNSIDGAKTKGRQAQQYNGTSSTTLSLDLMFDTADEGDDEQPVDVRTRTQIVRQFVMPAKGSKQAPPKVRFEWGTFSLVGTMASVTEELSLFASSGAPLRAKVSVQIKETDPRFEALESGPGANPATDPQASGERGARAGRPGTSGGARTDRVATALDGETPSDLLARNGLDPEGWRAVGDVLAGGVELSAGVEVSLPVSLDLGMGVGVSAGFHAGLDISLGASLGLDAVGLGPLEQGLALSSSGGLTAARERAKATAGHAAADAARDRFASPPRGVSASGPATGARQPLAGTRSARTQPAASAAPAPLPPEADPRSDSFGRGVPLRDRIQVPGSTADGYVVIGRPSPTAPTTSARSRRAPWEQLGPERVPRTGTGGATRRRRSGCGGGSDCGCGCGGGHR